MVANVLPVHPRRQVYRALLNYAFARNLRVNPQIPPVRSFNEQLSIDAPPPSLGEEGPVPRPIGHVSPECWQIVADAWRIELFIISERDIGSPRARHFPVVSRGDHNARQVFLWRDVDGAYTCIEPKVLDPQTWRYNFHIPKIPSKATTAEIRRSGRKRSPFHQLDDNGDEVIPLAAIPHPIAGQGYDVWDVPVHINDDFDCTPTEAEHTAYFNTDLWP